MSLNGCWRKDGSVSCLRDGQHVQSKGVPSSRILFDNGQNVALSLRQAHGVVGGVGGFACFALSLVRGWVGGGLLGDDGWCWWCRLGVGGGGHGSGVLLAWSRLGWD